MQAYNIMNSLFIDSTIFLSIMSFSTSFVICKRISSNTDSFA